MPKKVIEFYVVPTLGTVCRAFCLKKNHALKSLYIFHPNLSFPLSLISLTIFSVSKKTVLGQQQFTPLGIYHSNDDNVYIEDGKIISWILFFFTKSA